MIHFLFAGCIWLYVSQAPRMLKMASARDDFSIDANALITLPGAKVQLCIDATTRSGSSLNCI